jgi:hypothetical protein
MRWNKVRVPRRREDRSRKEPYKDPPTLQIGTSSPLVPECIEEAASSRSSRRDDANALRWEALGALSVSHRRARGLLKSLFDSATFLVENVLNIMAGQAPIQDTEEDGALKVHALSRGLCEDRLSCVTKILLEEADYGIRRK